MSRGTTTRIAVFTVLSVTAMACSSSDDGGGGAGGATTAPTSSAAPIATTTTPATTTAPETSAAPATSAATTTEAAREVLHILVTNDDGVAAAGLDTVVSALGELDGVEVTVIAPAENQSATSDKTTPGTLVVDDATTASGHPARAVVGFPADSVIYALDQGGLADPPDLVVSGINAGQNVGFVVPISGTIGAARTAAKRGIPAIAASQQTLPVIEGQPEVTPTFEVTAEVVVAWIEQNFDNLLRGTMPPFVYNINGPTCSGGEPREVVTVPVATVAEGRDFYAPSDCLVEPSGPPVDDMDALVKGYVAYTELDPVTLAPAG